MSRAGHRNDPGCAAMERMSTPWLEELLREDFHAPEGGWTDMNELYCAAQVLAGREPDPSAAADRAWERFRGRYLPFAKARSSFYEDGGTPSSDAAPERHHSSFPCGAAHMPAAGDITVEELMEGIDSVCEQRQGGD